jgi:hypothetical protein
MPYAFFWNGCCSYMSEEFHRGVEVSKCIRSCLIVMYLLVSGVSHAALIDRGGGLIYDDVLDVTWLRDTQHAVTSGFSTTPQLTFGQAQAFADGLEYYDRVRDVTWNDWRLPGVSPTASAGYDPTGASSELGYMYYVNLGLSPIYLQDGKGTVKTDVFVDLTNRGYWTGSVLKPDKSIWVFLFGYGNLTTTGAGDLGRVWLVRDGDVGAPPASVPEPGTLALFAAALLALIFVRRRLNTR